jgi:GNAT superfamily N-acetyltransferase
VCGGAQKSTQDLSATRHPAALWQHRGVAIVVEPYRARPRADLGGGWPEFIFHDALAARYLDDVRERYADLELAVVDDGELVGAGWGVPLAWDGTVADLPEGYGDALGRSLAGAAPDTFAVMAAEVRADRRGRGVAGTLLTALADLAGGRGWPQVVCPVRPTHKSRYPLTPIERYVRWTRPDGEPFDPWIRTHTRLGARILAPAPRSQVITGTVAEWESWTAMAFPEPGEYVIPGGLSPLRIAGDRGEYVEPNVWLRHR